MTATLPKELVMRIVSKMLLASALVVSSISAASALSWNCSVPEIDGPAGLSVLAVLISVGMMAYERCKG